MVAMAQMRCYVNEIWRWMCSGGDIYVSHFHDVERPTAGEVGGI